MPQRKSIQQSKQERIAAAFTKNTILNRCLYNAIEKMVKFGDIFKGSKNGIVLGIRISNNYLVHALKYT